MTARRALLVLIIVLFPTAVFATSARTAQGPSAEKPANPIETLPTATVLCYHIVEAPLDARMEISRDTFVQHVRYLEMTGYNIVPLKQVYEFVTGKRTTLPRNAVVITIDDGWRSTYTQVFPEMKKRNWPFTVFIYPNIIGQTANALTWKQVKEMSDAGVDIQSHSLSHPYLTKRHHANLSDKDYEAWLATELKESKRRLEKQTGKTVEFIAYPYGDYDTHVAEAAGEAGYSAALTCDFGRVKFGSNPLRMKRVVIDKKMDFAAFRHWMGAGRIQLAEMTPKGNLLDPGVTIVTAKIPNAKSVVPSSVGMALLSLGNAIPYSYDPKSGSISIVLRDAITALQGRYHRALVWATDAKTGRRVEASWTFRLPDPTIPLNIPLPAVTPLSPAPAGAPATSPASSASASRVLTAPMAAVAATPRGN